MDFFRDVGNFFRGAFGGNDDDEERKRREAEQRRQEAQRKRQEQQRRQQAQQTQQNQQRSQQQPPQINQLFGKQRDPDPAKVMETLNAMPKNEPVKKPVFTYEKARQQAQQYQKPEVQDVNNYYGNDLQVLNEELKKGDKADLKRVQGVMQSLDNRKKELQEFHSKRGEQPTFKGARDLEDKIQQTRGDWSEQNKVLEDFWGRVEENEKSDFLGYLAEKGLLNPEQAREQRVNQNWVSGTGQRGEYDFSKERTSVEEVKKRQELVDQVKEQDLFDEPLDQLGNYSISDYLEDYAKQTPKQQRSIKNRLEENIQEIGDTPDNPEIERKLAQSYILLSVLDDSGLQDVNKVPRGKLQRAADFASIPGRNILRVATGIPQGASGLVDLVSPGEGTSRVSDFLNKTAEIQDESAKDAGIETAYKVGNVPTEIASYFIPGVFAAKLAGKLPKAAKITEDMVDVIARNVDNSGDAGKVRKFLSDRMRRGWTLREAIFEANVAGRYIGQNSARGNETTRQSVATDVAAAAGGTLLFPSRLINGKPGADDLSPKVRDRLTRQIIDENPRVEDDLRRLVDDESVPASQRRAAQQELAEIDRIKLETSPDPLDSPAYQHRQDLENIVREQEDDLQRYLDENQDLTQQQREAAVEATKQKIVELTDALKARRAAGGEAIEGQAKVVDEAVDANQAAKQTADEQRLADTGTPEAVQAETPQGSPEVRANSAYAPGRSDTEVLFEDAPTFQEKGRLSTPQLLSLDRLFRQNVTEPAEQAANKVIGNAQVSKNPFSRFFGRSPQGLTREAGVSPELIAQRRKLRGGGETGKYYRDRIDQLGKDLSKQQKERVWSTLDPDQAAKTGTKVATDLTPEEIAYQGKLKEIINYTSQGNYARGLIDDAQLNAEDYIKRGYSVFEDTSDMSKAYKESRQSLVKQFKGREADISEELLDEAIKDPGYLVAKKSAESHAAWAMVDYGDYLSKSGLASDIKKPGHMQLPNSKLFGESSGKWVPQTVAEDFTGFQYTNGMLSAYNDLVTAYDSLGIRRAKKQLLTVFNPAVRVGNQFSNRVVFANMNGINPVQFNVEYARAGKMIKEGHQLYREALENGLMGTDITQADFARRVAQYSDDPNIGTKAIRWFQESYSGADDKARLTAYTIHRNRGYSVDEAVRMTQRGFQDYNQVGFMYDLAAKTPVIGNAFVRFAGDAIRIAKNAAVDHPLRTTATIAMWQTFVNAMSVASGESELVEGDLNDKLISLLKGDNKSEDQITRENRFGTPKVPFTDISLAVQTPFGEVNASRFLPFYSLNNVGSEAERFMPIQGNPAKPENWNDPLLGQIGQAITDTDFRGQSIRDPGNTEFEDGTKKYEFDELSDEEKRKNLYRFLFTQNAPVGREIDSVASANKKQLLGGAIGNEDGEDVYGKTRNPLQALLRAGGIKVEQFGSEQAEDTRGIEAFFDRLDETMQEVEGMSPGAQQAYRRLTGQYKLRDQKENIFKPGETTDVKAPVYDFSENKWGEYMQHPELFEVMEARAKREAEANGAPLHPFFDPRLPKDFRMQLVQQRSIAPGDDLELFERMTNDPRWETYQAINDEYKAKASEYYPQSDDDEDFTDEMVKHQDAPFPDKPPLWQKYIEAREQGIKPEWNDELQAARDEYEMRKLDWTNTERKARGLPPIPAEQWMNETFGYSDDDNGWGGFGFGGSNRPYQTNQLGRLSNFTGQTKRLDPIEAEAMPDLARLFAALQAGGGGGRRKPPFGGRSSGQ